MGVIKFLKKEKCITHLVPSFRRLYRCGDLAAILSMRENYTLAELEEIVKSGLPLFKDEYDDVEELDSKYRGM